MIMPREKARTASRGDGKQSGIACRSEKQAVRDLRQLPLPVDLPELTRPLSEGPRDKKRKKRCSGHQNKKQYDFDFDGEDVDSQGPQSEVSQ
jgi:hypothetical protein